MSAREEKLLRQQYVLWVFAFAAATVCTYAMRRVDPDLYGYLTYGRLFMEQGRVTTHDPFAFTSAGMEWVTFEYLAHVLLWLAYHYGGPLGLIIFKCLVGGVAMYFLFAAIRVATDDPFVQVPVFLLSASTVSRFFLFRPQLVTFACFAVFVAVLFRFLIRRRAALWILPPVMLVWANAHGGFLAGLGAVGLAILLRASENVGSGRQPNVLLEGTTPLWVTLAACLPATLANPRGWRLWVYVLSEVFHSTNRRYIAEWSPPSLSGDVWSTIALTVIALALGVVGVVARRGPGRVSNGPQPIYWVMSCVPLITMAYVSIRHVPLAAIWTGPVIALLVSQIKARIGARVAFGRVWLAFTGLTLVPVFLTFAVVLSQPWPAIEAADGVLGSTHPCRAVAFLRENHLQGNLYNPLWWGSYITWELYPGILVSMDGRNISLFSDEMVGENLEFYSADETRIDVEAPVRYKSDFLLVPADQPALRRLEADRRWQRLYADRDAVLFVRTDASHQSVLSAATNGSFTRSTNACPQMLK